MIINPSYRANATAKQEAMAKSFFVMLKERLQQRRLTRKRRRLTLKELAEVVITWS